MKQYTQTELEQYFQEMRDTITNYLQWSEKYYDNKQTNADIARKGLNDIFDDLTYLLSD